MPDGIPGDAEDVVGVVTERIEARFAMSLDQVAAAPGAHPDAAGVMRRHALLVEAQSVLDRAQDDLLAALETQPGEADDPVESLAQRVTEAVTERDRRAMDVWLLLDTPRAKDPAAGRRRPRPGPAVQTSAPYRRAVPPATATAQRTGRPVR